MQYKEERIDDLTKDPEVKQSYNSQVRIDDAWISLLKSRSGRVILRDLLQACHFGASPWMGNSEGTLVQSGKQLVGEHVMMQLNRLYPEAYSLMIKESKEDEEYDRSNTNTSGTSSNTSS